jgi:hypothetical protein
MAIAAEGAARHSLVRLGALKWLHRAGSHAHNVVTVMKRVAGELDPGDPRMPGPVSFVPFPVSAIM